MIVVAADGPTGSPKNCLAPWQFVQKLFGYLAVDNSFVLIGQTQTLQPLGCATGRTKTNVKKKNLRDLDISTGMFDIDIRSPFMCNNVIS